MSLVTLSCGESGKRKPLAIIRGVQGNFEMVDVRH